MLALLTAGFAVSSALRPRGEEDAGRVEALLATALPRRTWLAGHVAVTVVGTLVVLAAAGLGLGVSYALVTGDAGAVGPALRPAPLTFAPAVLVLSGLARLLLRACSAGVRRGLAGAARRVAVLLFGDVLHIPQWLQDVSPFEHLALVPLQDFRLAPFLVLSLLVAVALSAAGQLAFRRRDRQCIGALVESGCGRRGDRRPGVWSRPSAPYRALDGLDLNVAAGRGARLPRPERRRQVHDAPGAAGAAAGRRRLRDACSGRTRGATRSRSTGGSPTCPGDVALWPNLSGGETVDMLLRMRGVEPGTRPSRGAAGAVRPRPDQEGPGLLQGQPAEGRAGRGASPPTSTCWSSTSRPPAWTR